MTLPHPEFSASEFRREAARVAEWAADYRERIAELPVRSRAEPGDIARRLSAAPPREPESIEAILADVDEILLPGLTHWSHPGFLAYFASSASGPGILAEFVIAALGVNAMLWRTSPAATELEERVVAWLRDSVGLPAELRGVILDTASTASFTALLAAREAIGAEIRTRGMAGRSDLAPLTVYVSQQAHSSLEKAAIAAGLGQRQVRKVPTDARLRMDPEALRDRIAADRDDGRLPTMVAATIGTTSSASIDPVDEIAAVTAAAGVWLHVDSAYAGPAAMVPELRPSFAGWELADSVVLNPHKWMGTPMDCSVLLFREPERFRASLALTPEYLETGVEGVTNLMDYGLALGRRFRALKLWFLFRGFGTEGLVRMFRWHVELASRFAERIESDPRFELAAPVSFSTVCFRAVPPEGADSRTLNERILEDLNRGGRVFLSHTELNDVYVLHLSVGGVGTRTEDVDAAWEGLCRAYAERTGDDAE